MFHCFLGACKIVVEHCCYLQPKSIAPVCMFMKVICRLIVNIVLWGNVSTIMNGKNSQWNFLHIEKWAYFACIAAFWEILYWITPFFCFTRTVSLSMKYIYIKQFWYPCVFQVHNFSTPVLILPHESRYIFSLLFRPVRPSIHIDSNILLITNASKFHLPVRAYTGFLEVYKSLLNNCYLIGTYQ